MLGVVLSYASMNLNVITFSSANYWVFK
uniref:Uncharacterized protein n=1 Tax=Rhizophora mucronata TaxID=61149 RepID=A0A2P2Q6F5_RHIMU